jgi:hypothetical protein
MAHEVIAIPGGSTTYEGTPEVQILSTTGRPILSIKYVAAEYGEGKPQVYGEIKFLEVLEYRWVDFDHFYSPYDEDDEGEGLELIRITDSKWIEEMASKGWFQKYPGQRFGPGIDESRIKHYRLTFDDYGTFDVISFDITIRELVD